MAECSTTSYFRRKYGMVLPKNFDPNLLESLQEFRELKELSKNIKEFSEQDFRKDISINLIGIKKEKSKIILLNSVKTENMGLTKKAFFLSDDFKTTILPDQISEINKLKVKNQKKYFDLCAKSKPQQNFQTQEQHKEADHALSVGKSVDSIGLGGAMEEENFRGMVSNNFNEDETKKEYCICKSHWGGTVDEKMIGCDGYCREWYHPSCISMTKLEQNLIDERRDIFWLCPFCLEKNRQNKLRNQLLNKGILQKSEKVMVDEKAQ